MLSENIPCFRPTRTFLQALDKAAANNELIKFNYHCVASTTYWQQVLKSFRQISEMNYNSPVQTLTVLIVQAAHAV